MTETRTGRSAQEPDPGIVDDQDPEIAKDVQDQGHAIEKGRDPGTEKASAKNHRANQRNQRERKSQPMVTALLKLQETKPKGKDPRKGLHRHIDGEGLVQETRTVKDGDPRRGGIETKLKLREIMTKKRKGLKSSLRVHQKRASTPLQKTWTFPIHLNQLVIL